MEWTDELNNTRTDKLGEVPPLISPNQKALLRGGSLPTLSMKGALQDNRYHRDQMGDFVDIESTINYSSCFEPSLCMGKRGSFYLCLVGKRVNGRPKRDGKKPTRKNGPRVVHFIRDSEYKISGIKKRLDSFFFSYARKWIIRYNSACCIAFLSRPNTRDLHFPLLHRAEALLRRAFFIERVSGDPYCLPQLYSRLEIHKGL